MYKLPDKNYRYSELSCKKLWEKCKNDEKVLEYIPNYNPKYIPSSIFLKQVNFHKFYKN